MTLVKLPTEKKKVFFLYNLFKVSTDLEKVLIKL
jgi:hypothetical protein